MAATVQQLEKLHYVQRQFVMEDSLESTVAAERIGKLIDLTEKLIKQKAFLRDERRRLRIIDTELQQTQKALERMKRTDWLPQSLVSQPEERIRINIGGLMFESKVSILCRDTNSLLATLCQKDPPPSAPYHPDGFFFFDRDWWLFRFILTFLRDGTLPDDRALLAQLYRECSFWNLREMQVAIEESKLHLREPTKKEKEAPTWWRKYPSWWTALEEEEMRKKEAEEEKKKKEAKKDWWLDTKYNGKQYLPIPPLTREEIEKEKADKEKAEKEKASKEAATARASQAFLSTTWKSRPKPSSEKF